MEKTLNYRRAKFVYEGARIAAVAAEAPIVPEPYDDREEAFRVQFEKVIERQMGPERSSNAGELHEDWVRAYEEMGWRYGPVRDTEKKEHPDMVPYDELGHLERDKDAVFVALCEIARKWVHEPDADCDDKQEMEKAVETLRARLTAAETARDALQERVKVVLRPSQDWELWCKKRERELTATTAEIERLESEWIEIDEQRKAMVGLCENHRAELERVRAETERLRQDGVDRKLIVLGRCDVTICTAHESGKTLENEVLILKAPAGRHCVGAPAPENEPVIANDNPRLLVRFVVAHPDGVEVLKEALDRASDAATALAAGAKEDEDE